MAEPCAEKEDFPPFLGIDDVTASKYPAFYAKDRQSEGRWYLVSGHQWQQWASNCVSWTEWWLFGKPLSAKANGRCGIYIECDLAAELKNSKKQKTL